MATIKVKLTKSLIGQKKKVRATAKALGLTKIGRVCEYTDSPAVRGMIHKVQHMVEVVK